MFTIGFHTSVGGNKTGIGDHFRQLDAAGIPICLVSIGDYGVIHEVVLLMRVSGVAHQLVFRVTGLDVPNYGLDPATAALNHWAAVKAQLPPEFDKERVWLCPLNEIDKGRADWLGNFAAVFAASALGEGYKVTMYGWSSGEPEPAHWQTAGQRRYLEMCAANPNRAAVALHEYSYEPDVLNVEVPSKIGRFQALFAACDSMGIARPTVHITEFGWTHEEVPPPDVAMPQLDWAYKLYAPHPQIKGLAIWGLISEFGGIANLAQKLIAPVTEYMLNAPDVDPVDPPPPDPLPPGRVVTTTTANVRRVPSTSGNTPIGTVPAGTEFEQVGESGNWCAVKVWVSKDVADPVNTTPPPPAEFTLANPCQGIPLSVNDPFGTPRSYPGDHEGIDLRATTSNGQPVKILASAAGIVDGIRATDPGTGYGLYVRLRHELPGVKWVTWYCHLSAIATGLQVGQPVNTGHILGTAGSTGNSTGVHLHLTVQKIPGGLSGYVVDNVVDPAPLLGIGSTPPPSTLIDLRRFKIADPDCWRVVRNQHGQQEDVQDLELGGGVFVRRKNDLAEWHKRDNTFFYLIHDTSPAPGTEGIERVYTLYKLGVPGAPKSRIQQAVGETWTEVGTHTVQFRAKDDCRNLAENSGNATNNSTIIRYERNYTFNGYGQNLTFEEVIWERTGGETQIYGRMNGKSCGWIGWQETPTSPVTEPVEIHFDRGRMTAEPRRYCGW